MTRMDANINKKWNSILCILTVIFITVSLLCGLFISYTKKVAQTETTRALSQILDQVVSSVNQRFEQNYLYLNAAGAAYLHASSPQAGYDILKSQLQYYGFEKYAIIGENYIGQTTDGEQIDFSNVSSVQTAMAGNRGISPFLQSTASQNCFIYAVPLSDFSSSRVIAAFTTLPVMSKLLSVESFQGEGFSQIISSTGDVIVSAESEAPIHETNFFVALQNGKILGKTSASQIQASITAGESGDFRFHTQDGTSLSVCYGALNNGWHLLSMVPETAVGRQFTALSEFVVAVAALVFIFIAILILYIGYSCRKSHNQIIKLAFRDPLTGGNTQSAFELEVGDYIEQHPAGTYAFVLFDLQNFKLVNNLFGIEAGDRTLQAIYYTLSRSIKPDEYLARGIADQFELLLRLSSPEDLKQRLTDMSKKINTMPLYPYKYVLSFTAGIYPINDPSLTITHIRDRANIALKHAKQTADAQACYCLFYDETDRKELMRQQEIINRMDDALINEEFVVYLQPQQSLRDGKIIGAEALVRWQDPTYGLIPPSHFIPLFEKNRFIIKLDLYVFEKTCAIIQKWISQGHTPVSVSVNMSKVHLDCPDFVSSYEKIRQRYHIPASLLEFEFTETMMSQHPQQLLQVVNQIHAYGYRCSLDDFGSGDSSFNLLKDIWVDTLKLDKAFFGSSQLDNPREKDIITSIIDLSGKLGMQTVAEGVETNAQRDFLRAAGCDIIQGYLFSRPLPILEFEKLMWGSV